MSKWFMTVSKVEMQPVVSGTRVKAIKKIELSVTANKLVTSTQLAVVGGNVFMGHPRCFDWAIDVIKPDCDVLEFKKKWLELLTWDNDNFNSRQRV